MTPVPRQSARRQAGFALLIVLWALVLVALLLIGLSGSARTASRTAFNVRTAARGEAAADAAINRAIFAVLAARAGQPDAPDGLDAPAADGIDTEIRIVDEGGKINPNVVGAPLLRALLAELGLPPRAAGRIADAIVDWRTPGTTPSPHGAKAAEYRAAGRGYGPPGAPFQSLSELGQVLGMTPELVDAMAPYLTLWWDADPDPARAGPVVRGAILLTGMPVAASAQQAAARVVTVVVTAHPAGGGAVRRAAVVRFGYAPDGRGWRVLDWGDVPADGAPADASLAPVNNSLIGPS